MSQIQISSETVPAFPSAHESFHAATQCLIAPSSQADPEKMGMCCGMPLEGSPGSIEDVEPSAAWTEERYQRLENELYLWVRFPLQWLDPDCDDITWKDRRIGAMAHFAKKNPRAEPLLRDLTHWWCSGDHAAWPSYAWCLPNKTTQLSREDIFMGTWNECMRRPVEDDPYTLRTIMQDALDAGWVPEFIPGNPWHGKIVRQQANGVDLDQLGERNGLTVKLIRKYRGEYEAA